MRSHANTTTTVGEEQHTSGSNEQQLREMNNNLRGTNNNGKNEQQFERTNNNFEKRATIRKERVTIWGVERTTIWKKRIYFYKNNSNLEETNPDVAEKNSILYRIRPNVIRNIV